MSQKQKTPLQLAMLFSLLAWASAFYALWHQVSLTSGAMADSAFCNINSYISCDTVALSPYSMLFGVPLAAFAMAFYSVFLVLSVLVYFAEVDKRGDRVKNLASWLFIMSLAGLPVTLYYAVISIAVLKTLCLSCFAIYALHIILVVLSYKIKKNSRRFEPTNTLPVFSFSKGMIITFAVIAGVNLLSPKIVANSLRSGPQMDTSTLSLYVAQHLNNPQFTFSDDGAAVSGPKDAPITIVTFSDYQCPYCKLAANVIPAVTRAYGDKVRIIYKDYPLSSECNPRMTHAGHPHSCQTAKLTRCALKNLGIEAYLKLSKSIYAKQERLGTDTIKALAVNAGLSDAQVSDCLTNLAIHEAIIADVNEGSAAGVEATPSIYVNGRRLESAVNPQILRMAIDHYLKRL
jgi:protein-disulfide isomerase/uncharacterized membrane protein